MPPTLIQAIKVDGTYYCINGANPHQHFTNPIFDGAAASGGLMPSTVSGDNVFNIYQANPNGDAGSNDGYGSARASGGIKFGVHPCAEEIEIEVVGRNDIYGSGFDTLKIDVNGSQIAFFESSDDQSYYFNSSTGKYVPALSGVNSINETVTHTFSAERPCGHIVEISGISGSIANNNVGYDVKITVTL